LIDTFDRHDPPATSGVVPPPLEPLLHQASAAVSRIVHRLTHLVNSPSDDADGAGAGAVHPFARIRGAAARLARRDGIERLIPIGLCFLLAAAALVSWLPEVRTASAAVADSTARPGSLGGAVPAPQFGQGDGPLAADYNDLYRGDGSIPNTMQNPAVGIDAKTLLRTYTVVSGDTLGGIAGRFGLATSTVYWANKAQLPDPASLRVGQQLLIPPLDGLIVKVVAKDTIASIAAQFKVSAQDIVDANNLPDTTLVLGQTLLIPGASGGPMPVARGSTGRWVSPGYWQWPVAGSNYISQYFWSGHHAIDIAAASGTPVIAAVGGTVVFAGWRSFTGGGNVIWVQQGTKLYTTYNHLSAWRVRAGQKIVPGQYIGNVGATGEATGPHLHFEVWLGYPWETGTNATAVNPCGYLAGC
jgi:murein DD-endopeptidase MepM/ murein hydrolase activator NlpD